MENRIVADNLAELYRLAAEQYGELPAFATRKSALNWKPISFRELYEKGRELAAGLIDLGVEQREHVGLFSDNRREWIISDYGIQLCGAVNVPRERDVTDDDLLHIVNHAGIRVAFVETQTLQDRMLELRDRMPELREVILMDPKGETRPGVHRLEDLRIRGRQIRETGDRLVEERMADIRQDDLFTLIYTSGTTGTPKGVMLTHANMMSQMKMIPISLNCTDRVLSILPVWHIFERVFEVYTISCGVCTYYTSVRMMAEDLKNVEPTFMGSAPRLWEKLHEQIMERIRQSHPVRRALFHIAWFLGRHYKDSTYYLTGTTLFMQPEPLWKRIPLSVLHALRWLAVLPWYGFFNAAVLEPIRLAAAGGSLKATVSGGGALPDDIDRFFNYVGIPVLEGYGLTETSPVVAVRTESQMVVGTVGPLVPHTQICIMDPDREQVLYPDPDDRNMGRGRRGEVWVKGPQVMKGYYRQPELTDKALRDGWFRTGDMGMVTFNDCLKILGRCKSTIVLSNGENLEPEPIEDKLRQSPYIEHCMVVGQDQRHLGALIVPNEEELRQIGANGSSLRDLTQDDVAHQVMEKEIRKRINPSKGFRNFELIRSYRMVGEPFEVGDELTNLFKLKRHVVERKYRDLIHDMF